MTRWLKKKRADVLRRWKANNVSLEDAARELAALGVRDPWILLEGDPDGIEDPRQITDGSDAA